ncbi:unnamed protein product [Soboliphyme baturini]|uniref:Uncharacterized protein n=1 Tax=Soboliphyme baturini TaxID=241478 RepID=A0A183J7R3_9BILA|nr:unnamed protein product [Soboliphyme baturini]
MLHIIMILNNVNVFIKANLDCPGNPIQPQCPAHESRRSLNPDPREQKMSVTEIPGETLACCGMKDEGVCNRCRFLTRLIGFVQILESCSPHNFAHGAAC